MVETIFARGHVGRARLARALTPALIASVCAVVGSSQVHSSTVTFVDATVEVGLDIEYSSRGVYGPGVAAADYDGDGDIDIFLSHDPNKLFRNEPAGLRDVAPELGLALTAELPPIDDRAHPTETDPTSMMPCFIDIDGDGDRDLFLTGWNTWNRFYRNLGQGQFVEETFSTGMGLIDRSATAAFGDFSTDGYVDVYVATWGGLDRLYRTQEQGGSFRDVSANSGVHGIQVPARASWSAVWFYQNADTLLDLYVGIDYGMPNFMFRNQGSGSFSDYSDQCFPDFLPNASMGQALGDYDHDGDHDLFVANSLSNNLYQYDSEADVYTDLLASPSPVGRALKDKKIGWFCDWPDVDNDGWVDLFLVNGYIPLCLPDNPFFPDQCGGDEFLQSNRLWMNDTQGSFVDATASSGIGHEGPGRAALVADFDLDGDVDFFVTNNFGRHVFHRNDTTEQGSWLTLRLEGNTRNSDAISARVFVEAQGVVHRRDRLATSGYLSQPSDEIYVGLGDATVADKVTVIWSNGTTDEWTQVDLNQRVLLKQGASGERGELPVRPQVTATNDASGVIVQWTVDQAEDWSRFRVYRTREGQFASTMATLDGSARQYVDETAELGQRYHYRIEATIDGVGVTSERASLVAEDPDLPPTFNERQPRLAPNYPNPFNPNTVVPFVVPVVVGEVPVTLTIHDAAGRVIVVAVDAPFAAGQHEVSWDGTDAVGRPVGSGVYFVRLTVEGFSSVARKLTLIR